MFELIIIAKANENAECNQVAVSGYENPATCLCSVSKKEGDEKIVVRYI
jgi:hypothetical protein